ISSDPGSRRVGLGRDEFERPNCAYPGRECSPTLSSRGVIRAMSGALLTLSQSQNLLHPSRDVGQFLFSAAGDFAGSPTVIANFAEGFEHFGPVFVPLADRAPAL